MLKMNINKSRNHILCFKFTVSINFHFDIRYIRIYRILYYYHITFQYV